MLFNTIIALLFCISAVSINALERCPGASSESQEDFKWKYDAAPIVAYGSVSDVKDKTVTLKISCTLKGPLPVSTVDLQQFSEVTNLTECHYLTLNKNYIVFLESIKTTGSDSKILYRLADMEEIEINSNTVNNFINDECADEEDYGIDMTIYYADNNLKCGQFTATCNQLTKTSILALTYPPLSKSTTFLGGFKKTLAVPKMNPNDDGAISGKQGGGISDELYRSSATIATIWMPIILFITGLTMMFNI